VCGRLDAGRVELPEARERVEDVAEVRGKALDLRRLESQARERRNALHLFPRDRHRG